MARQRVMQWSGDDRVLVLVGGRWKDVMCCCSEAVRYAGPMGSKGCVVADGPDPTAGRLLNAGRRSRAGTSGWS